MTDTSAPRCYALVPCAGTGKRAGDGGAKQYRPIAGRALVAWTLDALARVSRIDATLVMLAPDDDAFERHVPGFVGERGWVARRGGASRAETVANGLDELAARPGVRAGDWVLVHDAARCLIRPEWVDRLIDACIDDEVGGLLAVPIADTIKQASGDRVEATIDRGGKWAAQTPQMFRIGLLRNALAQAGARAATDEASAVEASGHAARLVRGDIENFKLTWPSDLALAERLLDPQLAGLGEPLAFVCDLVQRIAVMMWGRAGPSSTHQRMAGACFAVVQEHHHAMVMLAASQRPAAAFTLMRPCFEAYVRGEWLACSPSDKTAVEFWNGTNRPEMSAMRASIETRLPELAASLNECFPRLWGAMCSSIHTGGLQLGYGLHADAVEPRYPQAEVREVLGFASALSLMSCLSIAGMCDDEALESEVMKQWARLADWGRQWANWNGPAEPVGKGIAP